MGDIRSFQKSNLKPTTHAATQVQTVADVEPTREFAGKKAVDEAEAEAEAEAAPKAAPVSIPAPATFEPEALKAEYVSDEVVDGSVFPAGQKFLQVWTLTNSGTTAWPVGVSVEFVGGDHMFDADELNATVTTQETLPGQSASFSVDLITPTKSNASRRAISYWRLTTANGFRFGHKLWCDIRVEEPRAPEDEEEVKEDIEGMDHSATSSASSEMIFPKLDKEAQLAVISEPVESSQEETSTETETPMPEPRSAMHSPAWTVTLSEEEDGHTSDAITSEDDVESLMLDDEDYEVLETSDDDGYRRVI